MVKRIYIAALGEADLDELDLEYSTGSAKLGQTKLASAAVLVRKGSTICRKERLCHGLTKVDMTTGNSPPPQLLTESILVTSWNLPCPDGN